MYQIDNSTAASQQPAATAPGTPGFFTDGSLTGGTAATIVPAEWLNAVQQELINTVLGAGLTPTKNVYNQLAAAVSRGGFAPWTSAAPYALGAVVRRIDGTGGWINTAAGNTSNPDTGGAGWIACLGSTTIFTQAVTSGTVTLTVLQAASPIITLAGSLTGNVNLVLPAWVGFEWTIMDVTTRNGFSITAQTATGPSQYNVAPGANPAYGIAGGIASALPSGSLLYVTVFTSSGTFTQQPTTNRIDFELVGGGGGGGGVQSTASNNAAASQSGGSGSYLRGFLNGKIPPQNITIGAGGSVSAGGVGGTGGTTFFGSYAACPGGVGGVNGPAQTPPYVYTSSPAANSPAVSANVLVVVAVPTGVGGPGKIYGIGANQAEPGMAPSSIYGVQGYGYGCGGAGRAVGASSAAQPGLVGQSGIVIIREYS